jgi:hypothetical protein
MAIKSQAIQLARQSSMRVSFCREFQVVNEGQNTFGLFALSIFSNGFVHHGHAAIEESSKGLLGQTVGSQAGGPDVDAELQGVVALGLDVAAFFFCLVVYVFYFCHGNNINQKLPFVNTNGNFFEIFFEGRDLLWTKN